MIESCMTMLQLNLSLLWALFWENFGIEDERTDNGRNSTHAVANEEEDEPLVFVWPISGDNTHEASLTEKTK